MKDNPIYNTLQLRDVRVNNCISEAYDDIF